MDEALTFDSSHSIAQVDALDVIGKRIDGGADLVIIAGSWVDGDLRSQRRLLAKLENYLGFIMSEEFSREFGPFEGTGVAVRVQFSNGAHDNIIQLLEQCLPQVEAMGIKLVWQRP